MAAKGRHAGGHPRAALAAWCAHWRLAAPPEVARPPSEALRTRLRLDASPVWVCPEDDAEYDLGEPLQRLTRLKHLAVLDEPLHPSICPVAQPTASDLRHMAVECPLSRAALPLGGEVQAIGLLSPPPASHDRRCAATSLLQSRQRAELHRRVKWHQTCRTRAASVEQGPKHAGREDASLGADCDPRALSAPRCSMPAPPWSGCRPPRTGHSTCGRKQDGSGVLRVFERCWGRPASWDAAGTCRGGDEQSRPAVPPAAPAQLRHAGRVVLRAGGDLPQRRLEVG